MTSASTVACHGHIPVLFAIFITLYSAFKVNGFLFSGCWIGADFWHNLHRLLMKINAASVSKVSPRSKLCRPSYPTTTYGAYTVNAKMIDLHPED
jgi:hypothetical protein